MREFESKHTPGPWIIESNPTIFEGAQIAAYSEDGNRVLQVIVRSFNTAEDMALIAAAPNLLFQLRAAANYIDTLGGVSTSYRTAIVKAEGKT